MLTKLLIYRNPFKITQSPRVTLSIKDKRISDYHKLANTFNNFFVKGNLNVNPYNTGLFEGSFFRGFNLTPPPSSPHPPPPNPFMF